MDTVSFWMPLDPVVKRSALSFVPGSHRWLNHFQQKDFGELNPDKQTSIDTVSFQGQLEPFPDIDASLDEVPEETLRVLYRPPFLGKGADVRDDIDTNSASLLNEALEAILLPVRGCVFCRGLYHVCPMHVAAQLHNARCQCFYHHFPL